MDECRNSHDTLSSKIPFLLKNSMFSDINVIAGIGPSTTIIPAHKVILFSISTVFEEMLTVKNGQNEIVIPNYSSAAVEVLLKYIYTDKVDIPTVDVGFEAYNLGKEFKINYFAAEIEQFLKPMISAVTAVKAFVKSSELNLFDLAETSFAVIEADAFKVVNKKDFYNLPLPLLERIVQSSKLNLGLMGECKLFLSIIEWGNIQCRIKKEQGTEMSLRSVIEPLLPYIRFLTMTAYQFCTHVVEADILTTAEILPLLVKILDPFNTKVIIPFRFSCTTEERKCTPLPYVATVKIKERPIRKAKKSEDSNAFSMNIFSTRLSAPQCK